MQKIRQWYKRLNRPTQVAVWITALVFIWMASGLIISGKDNSGENTTLKDERDLSANIGITLSKAQSHHRVLTLNGVTEPNRITGLKAQTAGPIAHLPIKEGSLVREGDILVEIDPQNRPEQLRRADALVRQREIEFSASQRLAKQGYTTEVRYAESRTELEDARREQKQAQIDLKNTKIRAPYDGVLERLNAEVGDFVGVGVFGSESAIAQVVDLDPLVITSSIPQTNLVSVQRDGEVAVNISGHEALKASIRYRVEVELPNPNNRIPSGLTAEVRLPLETMAAHQISSSIVALDDAGGVGVKTVDAEGVVHFQPITVLDEDEGGLWVSGMPEEVWIVTQGQAFVNEGQTLDLAKVKREGAGAKDE